jgi:hypothetical protein
MVVGRGATPPEVASAMGTAGVGNADPGLLPRPPRPAATAPAYAGRVTVSTMLPEALHAPHQPVHLGASAPHSLHR